MDGTTEIIAFTMGTKEATGHRGEIKSQELQRHSRNDGSLFSKWDFFFFPQKCREMRPGVTDLLRMAISRPNIVFEVNSQWIGLSHFSTFFKSPKIYANEVLGLLTKTSRFYPFQKINKCTLTRFSHRFFEGIATGTTLTNAFKWSINAPINAKNS